MTTTTLILLRQTDALLASVLLSGIMTNYFKH